MKTKINLLGIISLVIFTICSCVANDPDIVDLPNKDVDFYYTSQSIHYVIGEEVSFVNTSIIGSSYQWDFGDGNSSTEKNPVHRYQEPGNYYVKLTVDGTYSVSKPIMISDIVPIIYVNSEDGSDRYIYNQTTVVFDAYVDNPEDLPVIYNWTFPAGTQGDGIDANGRSTLKEPKVVFSKVGSMEVNLQVRLGEKVLETLSRKVNVQYDAPVKTLYYAVKGGNIMAKRITENLDSDNNLPFDTQYKSGKHALTLLFSGDWLYVLDAGTRISFVTDPAGLGDGEIFVISHDWTRRESVIENYGGDSYMDFFYGYIDEASDRLHWADRRDGLRWIPTSTRNAKFDEDTYSYWVTNSRIGYYNKGITFGNVNGPFFKRDGVWYWSKNSNGNSFFRFVESDVDDVDNVPSEGRIMAGIGVRGAVLDEKNGMIYASNNIAPKRMVAYNIAEDRMTAILDESQPDSEGGDTEALYVTGMALDVEGGYLYWAYRAPATPDETNPLEKSGIKRIKIEDILAGGRVNDKVEFFIEGVEAYGLTIDNTLR